MESGQVRLRSPHEFPYIADVAGRVSQIWEACEGDVARVAERACKEFESELGRVAWQIRRRGHRFRISWWLELAERYDTFGQEHRDAERLLRVYEFLGQRSVAPFDVLDIRLVQRPSVYRNPPGPEILGRRRTRSKPVPDRLHDPDGWFRAVLRAYRAMRSDDSFTLLRWSRDWYMYVDRFDNEFRSALSWGKEYRFPQAWRELHSGSSPQDLTSRARHELVQTAAWLVKRVCQAYPLPCLEDEAWNRVRVFWSLVREIATRIGVEQAARLLGETGGDVLLSWWCERARWLRRYSSERRRAEQFLMKLSEAEGLSERYDPPLGLHPMPPPERILSSVKVTAGYWVGSREYREAVLAEMRRRGLGLKDVNDVRKDLEEKEVQALLRNPRHYVLTWWWVDVRRRRLPGLYRFADAWDGQFYEAWDEGLEPFASDPDLDCGDLGRPVTMDFSKIPPAGRVIVPYLWKYGRQTRSWRYSIVEGTNLRYPIEVSPEVVEDLRRARDMLDDREASIALSALAKLYNRHPEADCSDLLGYAWTYLVPE